MVSKQSVRDQLDRLGFKPYGWGKAEVGELHNILMPDEEIYDLVNGIYEGGFALLVATDIRLMLVDKKPLNYLTVEDLRFDLISEIDYSHRLLGAQISIASGDKHLQFRSYNQQRLRKVIGHVQHCMAESKKKQSNHQQDQNTHLGQINQQLQAYLIAQQLQQEQLRQQLQTARSGSALAAPTSDPVQPGPELSDYLFAQSLLDKYRAQTGNGDIPAPAPLYEEAKAITEALKEEQSAPLPSSGQPKSQEVPLADLYNEGRQEVFGNQAAAANQHAAVSQPPQPQDDQVVTPRSSKAPADSDSFEAEPNPLKIAYSKLPMALRNRKFSRSSSRLHSQGQQKVATATLPTLPVEP